MTDRKFDDPTSSETPELAVQRQQYPSSLHRQSPTIAQNPMPKRSE
jgi:hypothetical protein